MEWNMHILPKIENKQKKKTKQIKTQRKQPFSHLGGETFEKL